jgi:hypothetical protein
MARQYFLYADVGSQKTYDAEGSELNARNKPYIYSKEEIQVIIQYVSRWVSVDDFDPYTGFVGVNVSSSAVIDNDFNHVDKGTLVSALSGAITSIEISGLDNIPQPTGFIQLINAGAESETVQYTAVALNGSNFVFTVSDTLTYSYAIGDQANANDPSLVKSDNSKIDNTQKDTGLFTITLDADSAPYIFEIQGQAEIPSCLFQHKVSDDRPKPIFVSTFDFQCKNTLDDDGIIPPPTDGNYYTKIEVDALLESKIDKVPTAGVGNVAIFTADGGVEDGGTAGIGDMQKDVFDPQGVDSDAFDTINHNRNILNLVDADFTANTRTLSIGEIGKLVSVNLVAGAGTFAIEVPNLAGTERAKTTTINYASGTQQLDITTVGGTQEIGGATTQSIADGGKRIDIVANGTQYDITNDDRAEGGGASTPPVEDSYADTATMIADQGNQLTNYFYEVNEVYYQYLGTTNANLTDYKFNTDQTLKTADS